MNSIDTKIKFLWLSDIHYMDTYGQAANSDDLEAFLSSFHSYLDKFDPSEFDYILLSGDIAQEGSQEDYNQFSRDILDPLQKKFTEAQLLVVPGNHDVARKDAEFVDEFLASLADKNHQRLDFFEHHFKSFEKIFSHYTEAFNKNEKIPAKSSQTYKDSMLYGHVLDVKRKVIFVLLNTSWYSLGSDLLKTYIHKTLLPVDEGKHQDNTSEAGVKLSPEEKEDKAKADLEAKVKRLTKEISHIAEEYGNQMLGLDRLKDIKEISEQINNYNDFLVVTVMHHPLNWLSWGERVTTSDNLFHELRKQTDLLLTGHEHIPRVHRSERIHNMLHLQAGCFMHAAKGGQPYSTPLRAVFRNTDENWFSTLEINIKKRTVKQIKHYYDIDDKSWVLDDEYKSEKLNNKHFSTLSIDRREVIKCCISSEEKLLSALKVIYPKIERINSNLFLVKKKIIIFNTENQINVDLADLKDIIVEHDVETVQFLFVDIVNPMHIFYLSDTDFKAESKTVADLKALYSLAGIERHKSMDRLVVLDAIKNDFDFRFDQLRYEFFKGLSETEALMLRDLKFVSVIKPYWEFESLVE